MGTYFHGMNKAGNELFDTFPAGLKNYVKASLNREPRTILINNKIEKVRIGKLENKNGTLCIMTNEYKYVNRLKFFNELLTANIILLETMPRIIENEFKKLNTQTQELIHNLTSLNTYNIQDLFSLVPQQLLTRNITKQNELVRGILKEKPQVSASTFLNLIKYNLAMKIEFSVFSKTLEAYPTVNKIDYRAKEIVLSILQIFIEDFEKMNVTLSLDSHEKRLNIDYDCMSVSLYYILENALKYCAKGSALKIILKEEDEEFVIIFDMISLKIEDHEVNKLCSFGYRASNAIRYKTKGEGIGMYRVIKTLELNDASIEIIPRISQTKRKISNELFEHNQFKIRFFNQQNWMI